MTLDDIYECFIWDELYTDEEYEKRIQTGINEAKKYKYLYPFIQPMIPSHNSISVWEPCAKVIAMRTDEEIEPYLYLLFKWLQDINWPGAEIIYDRLVAMPVSMIWEAYDFSRRWAEKDNDKMWLWALDEFKKEADLK